MPRQAKAVSPIVGLSVHTRTIQRSMPAPIFRSVLMTENGAVGRPRVHNLSMHEENDATTPRKVSPGKASDPCSTASD